jgi:hypothetical protein
MMPAVLVACLILVATQPMLGADGPRAEAGPAPEFVAGELIIGFHDVPTREALNRVEMSLPAFNGWREMRHAPHYKGKPDVPHPLSKVRIATGINHSNLAALAEVVAGQRGVAYAELNGIVHMSLVPNDPRYGQQYGPQIIESEPAWDVTMGTASTIIAIADTGLNFGHEEFQDGAVWSNDDPVNGVDDDGNGFIDDYHGWDFIGGDNEPSDGNGHGSHVAGTAGARLNNDIGIAGMSNVTLMHVGGHRRGDRVRHGQRGVVGELQRRRSGWRECAHYGRRVRL